MRLLRTVHYSVLALIIVAPLLYLIAATDGVRTIADTWNAFQNLCGASSYTFVSYLFIHDRFASLFIIFIGSIGLTWSAIYVVRQMYYTKRLKAQLQAKTVIALSGNNDSVMLVKDNRLFALTVGFLKPCIYLSSKLKHILTEDELACVIIHEQHHRSSRDALLALALETLTRLLFFLPLFRSLVKYMRLRHELAADQDVLQSMSTDILASTILKSIDHRVEPIVLRGAAMGFSTISERVEYLINPSLKPVLRLSRLSLGLSVVMIFIILLAAASLKSDDAHAQMIIAQGSMSKAVIEHCRSEDFTFLPFSQSLRSEINMSIMFQ